MFAVWFLSGQAQASAAHRQAGRAASARAAAARATLFAACEGVRTPALAALDAPDLTAREREIARLAATACPTAAFAERLGIAVRTVDNHLHRAYAKLGVGSRGELAPLLLGPRHDA
jgi:DNA-binding CsgD family transcriptional regulator